MFYLPGGYYLVVPFLFCYVISFRTTTKPRKPVVINAWLPFLGYVFLRLPHLDWLLWLCRRIYGDIFTISLNGMHLHILLDPTAGPHVFRDHRTFTFQKVIASIETAWFGVPQNQATDPVLRKSALSGIGHHIVTQHGVDKMMVRFSNILQTAMMHQLHNINKDGKLDKDGVVVDMRAFIIRLVIECSGRTFWGDTWIADEDLIEDFMTWDRHVPGIVKGFPDKRGILARDRVLHRLEMVLQGELINASSFVAQEKRTYRENGYSVRDAAVGLLFLGFSTYSGAGPSSIWLLAHLARLNYDLVRPDIERAVTRDRTNESPSTLDVKILVQSSLLRSGFAETLRLHDAGASLREVAANTTVEINAESYTLEAGSFAVFPFPCVHWDAEIHENPRKFQIDRLEHLFRDEQVGKRGKRYFRRGIEITQPWVPFGGGVYQCLGRKFAESQILMIASTILHTLEITSVDGESVPPMPDKPASDRFGFGISSPAGKWMVRIRYRK